MEGVGACGQCAGDPAQLVVRLVGEGRLGRGPIVEQLAQCVLKERQRGWLRNRFGSDAGDEARFEPEADTRCGLDDRTLEFVGRQRHHLDASGSEQRRERRVAERSVVVVGAKGRDDPERGRGVFDCHGDGVEEPVNVVRCGSEQLFELVDEQQQMVAVGAEATPDAAEDASRTVA